MITIVVNEGWTCIAAALLVMACGWVWCLWESGRNPSQPAPLFTHPWMRATLDWGSSWDLDALNRDYVPETGQPRGLAPW